MRLRSTGLGGGIKCVGYGKDRRESCNKSKPDPTGRSKEQKKNAKQPDRPERVCFTFRPHTNRPQKNDKTKTPSEPGHCPTKT